MTASIEPEKERWRNIAGDWYGIGVAEQPGTGKLHHHLGRLSREVKGDELRGVYHFVNTEEAAQARRQNPQAHPSELFILLRGMLFTNIQLDDFKPILARFIERLEIEGTEEHVWIIDGHHQHLRHPRAAAAMRVMAKKAAAGVPGSTVDEERMDTNENGDNVMKSPILPSADSENLNDDLPPAFKFALEPAFTLLSHVLKHPTRKASQYSNSTLNRYLPDILTFLATVLKHNPHSSFSSAASPGQS
ncbi:hypothetical protein NLJ89_g10507 [Agrocybe chaxingu]|uniref:Uncharacterized protein n=1 Tax=Agrocybe chaxingu TaxID=84603 RepID=A0A9W8JNS4_9AGAR|nr:hypothetical protein NLJ89_g10507 [Agrocybe chaxingu]